MFSKIEKEKEGYGRKEKVLFRTHFNEETLRCKVLKKIFLMEYLEHSSCVICTQNRCVYLQIFSMLKFLRQMICLILINNIEFILRNNWTNARNTNV